MKRRETETTEVTETTGAGVIAPIVATAAAIFAFWWLGKYSLLNERDIVGNASDLEVENRLGTYEDAEEARAKAEQLLRQRNRLKSGWIPVTERLPENDDYVLMSFENFSLPLVGRYVDDEKLGGAWYLGDCLDEDTCLANDLFVNAWMPLPKPYREDEEDGK